MGYYYKMAIRACIRSQMQYRFSFIINALTYCIVLFCDILPIFFMMYHFKSLGGWSIYQVAALWGCVNISVSFIKTFCVEIRLLQNYVIDGSYDNLLIRPCDTRLQLMSRNIRYFKISGVIQGLTILMFSFVKIKVSLLKYLYLPIVLIGSIVLLYSLEIIIASLTFFMGRTGNITSTISYMSTYGVMHPINVYPKIMRWLFTIWPTAFLGYYQLESIFFGNFTYKMIILSIVIPLFFYFLSCLIWRYGECNYVSTGN